ncbi:phosphopantetheine-binding protein [Micromonospora echinofusca]|uniref:phosphopantetheine-binding protein n=1 Tax=Micromonospora TaxID=1873 RepID=UPI003427CD8E
MVDWPPAFEPLIRERSRLLSADAPLEPDQSLTELGVDSLEVVELIVNLETEFDIEIPPELLQPEVFATPGTIWNAVRSLM